MSTTIKLAIIGSLLADFDPPADAVVISELDTGTGGSVHTATIHNYHTCKSCVHGTNIRCQYSMYTLRKH